MLIDETSTEKEYVVVKSEDVPHAESEEVQASLPAEVISPPAESETPQAESQYAAAPAAITAAHQPLQPEPKSFEQIVGNVQGKINFIQDSVIDMDCK